MAPGLNFKEDPPIIVIRLIHCIYYQYEHGGPEAWSASLINDPHSSPPVYVP